MKLALTLSVLIHVSLFVATANLNQAASTSLNNVSVEMDAGMDQTSAERPTSTPKTNDPVKKLEAVTSQSVPAQTENASIGS